MALNAAEAMDDDFYSRCLLCTCTPDVTPHLNIFSEAGNQLKLAEKINQYLNIQIVAELPQNVCHSCIEKLEVTHELVTSSQQASITLLHIKQQWESFVVELPGIQYPTSMDCPTLEFDSYQPATGSAANHNEMVLTSNENAMAIPNSKDFGQLADDFVVKYDRPANDVAFQFKQSSNAIPIQIADEPTHFTVCPNQLASIPMDILSNSEDFQQMLDDIVVRFEQADNVCAVALEQSTTMNDPPALLQLAENPTQKSVCTSSSLPVVACETRNIASEMKQQIFGGLVKCDICNATAKHKYCLIKHKNKMHNMNLMFDCEHCGKRCLTFQRVTTHIRDVHAEKDHVCEICGKMFKKKVYLAHKKWHQKLGVGSSLLKALVTCAMCKFIAKNKISLIKHINAKHLDVMVEPLPFWCDLCDKDYRNYKNLWSHLQGTAHDPKQKCSYCGKFINQYLMSSHLMQHNSIIKDVQAPPTSECQVVAQKLLECVPCNFYTDKKTELEAHMQTRHQPPNNTSGEGCPATDVSVETAASCEVPTSFQHSVNQQKIIPEINAGAKVKKESEKRMKNRHIKKEKIEINFKCGHCNKLFHIFERLKLHCILEHPGHYILQCEICKVNFTSMYSYRTHQKYQHGPTVFTCNVCSATYSNPKSLETHVAAAHSAQSLECQFCGKTFKCLLYLRRHVRNLHTGRLLECEFCVYNTRIKHNLVHHLKKVHSK